MNAISENKLLRKSSSPRFTVEMVTCELLKHEHTAIVEWYQHPTLKGKEQGVVLFIHWNGCVTDANRLVKLMNENAGNLRFSWFS